MNGTYTFPAPGTAEWRELFSADEKHVWLTAFATFAATPHRSFTSGDCLIAADRAVVLYREAAL
jgi:hypothetical protein